jgi:hypothetical protein
MAESGEKLPAVVVDGEAAPVRMLNRSVLQQLGQKLTGLFTQFAQDRRQTELKYMRNLRQYLGIYDPEIDRQLQPSRSRAYPRLTRVKCISVLSRIMNLMYPGNEKNWSLEASPSADLKPEDVSAAVKELIEERKQAGVETPVTEEMLDAAIQRVADKRAEQLSKLIDDQLQELGGNQSLDVIAIDRKIVQSGIMYGLGVLEGPYVREEQTVGWASNGQGGYAATTRTIRKPQYEFTSVWDFYPDMSARSLPGEGYFLRKVMGRSQLRKLANRPDFFAEEIKTFIRNTPDGNYQPREFETELRVMGTKSDVGDIRRDSRGKYEVIVWKGPVNGTQLKELGAEVPEASLADEVDAEVWLLGGYVIKADINQWIKLGIDVKTVHCFIFDEDDTSPIGNGLPNVMRDSQMSVCAATRMTLDNASVTCGPNLEVNTTLLRADQDISAIEAYKIWYRDDDGLTAQYPAVRKVEVDGHLPELQKLIELFMSFADMETFVGPATGGDMAKGPSEPMRTAAGASMLRGDAALPFKDIIRNFDTYKQSQILALVQFNKKFNPGLAPEGDYNVIARGATSLIAKEVRGMQLDILAQSLTDDERDHIDERKFVEQRFAVRDMATLMVPAEEAARNKQARAQQAQELQSMQAEQIKAEVRKTLAEAFKNITQGQKNSAAADAQTTNAALAILETALANGTESAPAKSGG